MRLRLVLVLWDIELTRPRHPEDWTWRPSSSFNLVRIVES